MPFDEPEGISCSRSLVLKSAARKPHRVQVCRRIFSPGWDWVLRKESRTDASLLSSMGNPLKRWIFADTVCEIGFRKFVRASPSLCSSSVSHRCRAALRRSGQYEVDGVWLLAKARRLSCKRYSVSIK
jgi:hypothetical protein